MSLPAPDFAGGTLSLLKNGHGRTDRPKHHAPGIFALIWPKWAESAFLLDRLSGSSTVSGDPITPGVAKWVLPGHRSYTLVSPGSTRQHNPPELQHRRPLPSRIVYVIAEDIRLMVAWPSQYAVMYKLSGLHGVLLDRARPKLKGMTISVWYSSNPTSRSYSHLDSLVLIDDHALYCRSI